MKNFPVLFALLLAGSGSCSSPGATDTGNFLQSAPSRAALYTQRGQENTYLLQALTARLTAAQFKFEPAADSRGDSFMDCTRNRIIQVKGPGIRNFFARSRKPNKGTAFYPDFNLSVYEFQDTETATSAYAQLAGALATASPDCNRKMVDKLVRNGKEVFYLSSRAEMFRDYVERYGRFISTYKASLKNL